MYSVYAEELERNRMVKSVQRFLLNGVLVVATLGVIGAIGLASIGPAFGEVGALLPEAPQVTR
ncbi:hypothetical protein [Thalassovita sp.]|jgi:hypothetical protein|uniref:hypothetical protein n=1 Tax=Thalassovita sp. TaxID=1979401 RepID=UPI003B5A0DA3